MMPFDKRLDYAITACVVLFAGYTLPWIGTVVLSLLFSIDELDFFGLDDISLAWLFTSASLMILALGSAALFGAMLGSLLRPAVVIKRMHWLVCFLSGWLIAKVSIILLLLSDAEGLGAGLFLLAFLAAGFTTIVLRTIGMAVGWARRWYPTGKCQGCGYDLRVTPPGEPCPECGGVVQCALRSHT